MSSAHGDFHVGLGRHGAAASAVPRLTAQLWQITEIGFGDEADVADIFVPRPEIVCIHVASRKSVRADVV